jgi:uncharacterized hydrophobic protein (TIGR00271 family)
MNILARFQAIDDNHKASVVRKLMKSSTPDFDFLYFTGLSVVMATLGLLAGSPSIVIGSMLIAPVLYPLLGVALGLVMSNGSVLGRSVLSLCKAFGLSLALAIAATLLFGESGKLTAEILLRTDASLLSFSVAVVAGLAVSYALARPEWSETLPGIAISVALIPPLAVVGIGIAWLNPTLITGSLLLLAVNVAGIIFAAMVSFSLMDLHEKYEIAESTIKRETVRVQEEEAAIEKVAAEANVEYHA